jgi:hypothetical protein
MKQNKTVKNIFVAGEIVVLLMALTLAWFWKTLPPQVPWFYSLPGGEQQLVNKLVLAGILAGSAASLFVTRLVARWASVEDAPVEITIMTGGLVAVLLLAAGFFRVMQIIIGL